MPTKSTTHTELEKDKAFEHRRNAHPALTRVFNCKVQPLLKQHHRVPLISSPLHTELGVPQASGTLKITGRQGKEGCPLQLAGGIPAEPLKRDGSKTYTDRFSSIPGTQDGLWPAILLPVSPCLRRSYWILVFERNLNMLSSWTCTWQHSN